jgi:hypothetical protein
MYYDGCFFAKNPSQALSGKTMQPILKKHKNEKMIKNEEKRKMKNMKK